MIKRVFIVLLVLFVFIPLQSNIDAQTNAAVPSYKIVIDNKELKLSTPPFQHNGTTMVPFRPVFNQLGLDVEWDPVHHQVVGKNSEVTITLTIGSVYAKVNDAAEVMPLAPVLRNGTTYIPLRFVGTASGADVEFYGESLNVVWIISAKQDQLLSAVIRKNVAEVKRLLESGADPTIMVGPEGSAIYHFIDDSLDIVKLFLENGMDINYYAEDYSYSRTLLQIAAADGQVEIVKFLLDAGADPLIITGTNWTALEVAEYWRGRVEAGYQNMDPSRTPSVESYDEIIELLRKR
ncbi:stalk domain-containing protein [Paenibacillus fonticola]|uniref:stalk domain-containing protein n=1 Tax=Paenibacillus fonticola TaxID=379896 RepID=UPI0003608B47|nr:stalk domain-containing protein [Paenibacillus fonticola]